MTEIKYITEEELSRLHYRWGDGHLTVAMCEFCGGVRLTSKRVDAPNKVTVYEDNTPNCMHCTEISQRAPEIAQWVLNVVGYQLRKRGL